MTPHKKPEAAVKKQQSSRGAAASVTLIRLTGVPVASLRAR